MVGWSLPRKRHAAAKILWVNLRADIVPAAGCRFGGPRYQVLLPQVRVPDFVIVRFPSLACGVPVTGVAVSVNVVAVTLERVYA